MRLIEKNRKNQVVGRNNLMANALKEKSKSGKVEKLNYKVKRSGNYVIKRISCLLFR